jgi:N-succinyl-L-ornithine transcarbamylase
MNHFTQFSDINNFQESLGEMRKIKQNPFAFSDFGKNKTIGLFFFNPSLRTRLSTQKAAANLGLNIIVMNFGSEGWQLETAEGAVMNGDKAEHVKDAVGVLGKYCDIIGVRSFAKLQDATQDYQEEILHQFVQYAGVPILSMESAIRHPLQSLADALTILEHNTKNRPKVVLSWAPHPKALPQAVPNSFVEFIQNMEVELVITHPQGYELSEQFTDGIRIEYDQDKALADADFVYAKNWSSFREYGQILPQDRSWTITEDKMKLTGSAKFMHCLPVRRNVVVSDAVIDSPQSIVLAQAENRIYAAQWAIRELLS